MTNKIRIAYFTSVYPRASDSFIRGEVDALRKQGVEVVTFALRAPESSQLVSDELRREASSTNYVLGEGWPRLVLLLAVQFLFHPLKTLHAMTVLFRTHAAGVNNRVKQIAYLAEAVGLAKQLRDHGISHVHNHIGENSATVAMLASLLTNATYSMTIHGPGIFFHPRQWGLGEKIARSTFTACITHYCLSQCMIFSQANTWSKLRIIRCGVNEKFFHADAGLPTIVPRFVCVGRLCAEKGHLFLIRAVRRLVLEGLPIELHLVGDGESRLEIEDFVRTSGLEKHVILHGWCSEERIRNELSLARALVLPSFAEGLPVVFMEALAMRRPVIASCIAGTPELIENRRNGWLVKPADIDSLCAALKEAAECSLEELQQMGDAGWHRVWESHHADREASKLRLLFEATLAGVPIPDSEFLESRALVPVLSQEHSRPAVLRLENSK